MQQKCSDWYHVRKASYPSLTRAASSVGDYWWWRSWFVCRGYRGGGFACLHSITFFDTTLTPEVLRSSDSGLQRAGLRAHYQEGRGRGVPESRNLAARGEVATPSVSIYLIYTIWACGTRVVCCPVWQCVVLCGSTLSSIILDQCVTVCVKSIWFAHFAILLLKERAERNSASDY